MRCNKYRAILHCDSRHRSSCHVAGLIVEHFFKTQILNKQEYYSNFIRAHTLDSSCVWTRSTPFHARRTPARYSDHISSWTQTFCEQEKHWVVIFLVKENFLWVNRSETSNKSKNIRLTTSCWCFIFCAESMMKDFWLLFLNVYYQCETVQHIQCSQENLRRHKSNFTSTVTKRVERKWLLVAVGRANPSTEVVDDTKTASVSQPYAQHRPP